MVYTKRNDWSNRGMSGKRKSEASKLKQSRTRIERTANGKIPSPWNKGLTPRAGAYTSYYKGLKGRGVPMGRYVWCNQPGNLPYVPKGFEIHHLDFNQRNNDPKNLSLLDMKTHRWFHSQVAKKIGGAY